MTEKTVSGEVSIPAKHPHYVRVTMKLTAPVNFSDYDGKLMDEAMKVASEIRKVAENHGGVTEEISSIQLLDRDGRTIIADI